MLGRKNPTRGIGLQTGSLLKTGGTSCSARDTRWQAHHSRREEVNNRLNRQSARIHKEVKEGDLSKAQASSLHKDDRQIRQEERDMASQNGGHLTSQEKKTLNQQENKVSSQIGH
jgi:uncharacterized Zn finger protein (UPF0148 family)